MDAMRAALKAKRSGAGLMSAHASEMEPAQEGQGLKSLVESLSHEQKAELMGLLQKESSGKPSPKVEMGEPSDEERASIDSRMASDDMDDGAAEEGAVDSDQIAMDMLDSKYKGQLPSAPPRNLGERVKMQMASKLKAKGKI